MEKFNEIKEELDEITGKLRKECVNYIKGIVECTEGLRLVISKNNECVLKYYDIWKGDYRLSGVVSVYENENKVIYVRFETNNSCYIDNLSTEDLYDLTCSVEGTYKSTHEDVHE